MPVLKRLSKKRLALQSHCANFCKLFLIQNLSNALLLDMAREGRLTTFTSCPRRYGSMKRALPQKASQNILHRRTMNESPRRRTTIKFIENPITEIVVSQFKKVHGNKYWNYIGTKEMRVMAYERQQEDAVEKQLELEAYLDFIDKKRIVEKNYDAF